MDSLALDANAGWLGVSRLQLMENAGREIARASERYKRIAVVAGTGNNGGDGLVAARHLLGRGKRVTIYAIDGKRTSECQKNLDVLMNSNVDVTLIEDSSDCGRITTELSECDLIIDALIGVGLSGELREPAKSLIACMNASSAFKLSVDIPSGNRKLSVKADQTISFHTAKTPGAMVVDIGMPKEAELYCGPGDVCVAIPERKPESHKGDYGRILVVGGSSRYVGAPYLAAWAAMRTGVNLAVVCVPAGVAKRLPFNPNLIVQPLKSDEYVTEDDVAVILKQEYDAMVIGNGIGREDETKDAVREIISKNEKPVVIDADALRLIKPERLKPNTILTPHAGEFKKLYEDYEEDKRVKQVEEFAKETKAIVVLKGRIDVVSDGLTTRLNKTGNPGMTVGGTGDVLAGVIGSLTAQNKDPYQSACAGVFLNGIAGDFAYRDLGVSMTATDLIEKLPEAIFYCKTFM
jgi:hydroxyethylthiazole kinase-like uncharacterized protein yjeF